MLTKADTPFLSSTAVVSNKQVNMIEWIIDTWLIVSWVNWTALILKMIKKNLCCTTQTEKKSKMEKEICGTYTIRPLTNQAAHRKSNAAKLSFVFTETVTPRYRHIIDNPVMLIIKTHSFFKYHKSLRAVWITTNVLFDASLFGIEDIQF